MNILKTMLMSRFAGMGVKPTLEINSFRDVVVTCARTFMPEPMRPMADILDIGQVNSFLDEMATHGFYVVDRDGKIVRGASMVARGDGETLETG